MTKTDKKPLITKEYYWAIKCADNSMLYRDGTPALLQTQQEAQDYIYKPGMTTVKVTIAEL